MSENTKKFVPVAAFVAVVIGLLLPWIKGAAVLVGSVEVSGFDKLGSDALLLTAVAALAAYVLYRGSDFKFGLGGATLGLVLAALALAIGLYEWNAIADNVQEVKDLSNGMGIASVGAGVYVTLVGLVALVVDGFVKFQAKKA